MPAAAFIKFNAFIDELSKGGHNLTTAVFRLALSNTAPQQIHTVFMTIQTPPPVNVGGYPSGGNTLTTASAAMSGGTFKLVLNDSVFLATGVGIGPFRYAILYNSTQSDKLLGYYDYGSSISLADTETFTYDADAVNGVLTLA